MIKIIHIVFLGILIFCTACSSRVNYKETSTGVRVSLTGGGTLYLDMLSDNAVRVRLFKGDEAPVPEFVFVNDLETPEFEVARSGENIRISLNKMMIEVSGENGRLTFMDRSGKVFLSEKDGSRIIEADSVMGQPCFLVEQSFDSPENEYLFGLGQFQDGHFNLKNVTRKLVQVNSQISIPFLYSNRGYGILWHQYGLTYFNPADNLIPLKKDTALSRSMEMEATTTSGSQRIYRNQSLYTGSFTVEKDGEYTIFLDLGGMDSRHFVAIDDTVAIDQSNVWLPPAVSAVVRLSAGEHSVRVICNSINTPTLAWRKSDNATTFRSPHAKSLDYVVFYGDNADEVIASYRTLSGDAPLFPKWAYGYWQCRERYTSAAQLVETVREFRNRQLPMDVIVQDWQYWGAKGWGVPMFDETNYPNPSGFIKELHDQNARFAISIWSNPDKNSRMGQNYEARGLFIPGTKWLDYFNPETRKEYWNILKENMFDHGVDAWWMDAVEPENDALKGEKTYIGPGDFYRLTYPLMVSRAVYEGQRQATDEKRVCILTRSAFAGQQRYGVVNWSGDVGWDWDVFRRQIVAGLNFTLTGLPYWTTDIGGFFRPGSSQYVDKAYHELLTRWFQWGAFSPIFRMHGYQSETEPWKYGTEVEENMRKMLNLRYRLLPYIYSEAWKITNRGSTLMRPLAMDFPKDLQAVSQPYEYMFGQSFLVAPVVQPNMKEQQVYLPASSGWYDFWTGKRHSAGQIVATEAPLDKIPLFVKSGSIVPMGKFIQYSDQKIADTLEIRIYRGDNGAFELYEDEGDGYNYENGAYSIIPFAWDEQKEVLTIGERQGEFEGLLKERVFNIVWVSESNGNGIGYSRETNPIVYSGEKRSINIDD